MYLTIGISILLQVVQYRMQNEYGVETLLEPLSFSVARWVTGGWPVLEKVGRIFNCSTVKDQVRHIIYLNEVSLKHCKASIFSLPFLQTTSKYVRSFRKYRSEISGFLFRLTMLPISHISVALYGEFFLLQSVAMFY